MIKSFNGSALDGAIANMFTNGKKPHAVLIDGGTAEEREELSRFVASLMVCEADDKPCGACEHCRKINEKIHPDVISVKKPDDRKSFAKNDVKQMVADAFITPNEAKTKVYIVTEMQLMSEECQNVLLKILEEPPVYTAFILTSQTVSAVIGTVLSRVVRLRLGSGGEDFGEKAVETAKKIALSVGSPYEFDKIAATASLDGNKQLTAEVLRALQYLFRDAYARKNGGAALYEEFFAESQKLSETVSLGRLLDLYDTVCAFSRSLENNPNYTLLSAALSSKL